MSDPAKAWSNLREVLDAAATVGFCDEAAQVMNDWCDLEAEITRLRAEASILRQAVGLATTAVPDMVMDVTDPIGMMKRVVARVADYELSHREWIKKTEWVQEEDIGNVGDHRADAIREHVRALHARIDMLVQELDDSRAERARYGDTMTAKLGAVEARVAALEERATTAEEAMKVYPQQYMPDAGDEQPTKWMGRWKTVAKLRRVLGLEVEP